MRHVPENREHWLYSSSVHFIIVAKLASSISITQSISPSFPRGFASCKQRRDDEYLKFVRGAETERVALGQEEPVGL